MDSGKRTFTFKSKDGKPVIHKSTWTRTIFDARTEDAETYCADVTAWARSVLEDEDNEEI